MLILAVLTVIRVMMAADKSENMLTMITLLSICILYISDAADDLRCVDIVALGLVNTPTMISAM